MSDPRCVLLNSAGLDSLASMMRLHELGYYIHSLHLELGQPQGPETSRRAARLAKKFCDRHTSLPVFEPGHKMLMPSPWGGDNLPFLMLLVHTVGAIFTVSIEGITELASGADGGPLNQDDFIGQFLGLQRTSRVRDPITILMPIQGWNERRLMEYVLSEKLVTMTYSCNHIPPCGECPKCRRRIRYGIEEAP